MDVNFEYYKIFYYVAKYNNFTRAARVLGNSQPNVTSVWNSSFIVRFWCGRTVEFF